MAAEQAAPQKAGDGRGWRWFLYIIVGFPLVVIGGCFALAAGGSDADDEWKPTSFEAGQICEGFVKDRLKSPSSAKFSGGDVRMIDYSTNAYAATGAVDSQNGFGAMIRNDYECRVSFSVERDRWILSDLEFSGN